MQPLRRFHGLVLPDVPGCPLNVVDNALISTLIDFCEKSLLWKHEAEPTSVRAGYARYTFAPEDGTRVVEPVYVSLDKMPLEATSLSLLDLNSPGWRDRVDTTPTAYYMDTDDSIRLVGIPAEDMDDALEVHVALKPLRSSKEIPDFLFEDWAEIIAHGTLAKLHAMSNRTWADPSVVNYHYRKYRRGLSRGRSKALRSRQGAVKVGVQPRKFGDIF